MSDTENKDGSLLNNNQSEEAHSEEKKPWREVAREELGKPSLYISLIALFIAAYGCFLNKSVADKSRENLHINVERKYGKDSLIDLGSGVIAIKVQMFADITNLSDDPISIEPPMFSIKDDQRRPIEAATPPITRDQEPPGPIFIGPKLTVRVSRDEIIPLPPAASSLARRQKLPDFGTWREIAANQSLDELGRPGGRGFNLEMDVLVNSVDGKEFEGSYLWLPPFDSGR